MRLVRKKKEQEKTSKQSLKEQRKDSESDIMLGVSRNVYSSIFHLKFSGSIPRNSPVKEKTMVSTGRQGHRKPCKHISFPSSKEKL
jgi:hypothetical protein